MRLAVCVWALGGSGSVIRPKSAQTHDVQGGQGSHGSLTAADPRPAAPGEISDPRPATPGDPASPGWPWPRQRARASHDMAGFMLPRNLLKWKNEHAVATQLVIAAPSVSLLYKPACLFTRILVFNIDVHHIIELFLENSIN